MGGTGIPRLFKACEEYRLPKPELIDFDGDLRVNMYRKRDTNVEIEPKVNDKVNDLLEILKIHPDYTVTELANISKVSRKTIAARLKKLKEQGFIERKGSSRKGYWQIK